jgi:hypothetical protein
VVEMSKPLYRRLGWVLDILEDANKGMKKLVSDSPNTIAKGIADKRTQIDSARIIITEIIEEHKRKQQKNESITANNSK